MLKRRDFSFHRTDGVLQVIIRNDGDGHSLVCEDINSTFGHSAIQYWVYSEDLIPIPENRLARLLVGIEDEDT